MTKTTTKIGKVRQALSSGFYTAKALRQRAGSTSTNSVYAMISKLSEDHNIVTRTSKHGLTQYRLAA